jgi:hypothetical protein
MKKGVTFMITKKEDGDIVGGQPITDHLLNLLPGRWVIEFTKYKPKRSIAQNSYYWGVVINCVRDGLIDMGFEQSMLSAENIHEMLKAKFLKQDIANDQGEFITMVRGSSELNKLEFMDYIDDIHRWAAEFLGINIPSPGQQGDFFE